MSTVNEYAPEDKRKLQNPNVLIELGYAIAHVGWERIIMLCNETSTKVADLPFDIDRHRASKFCIKGKHDKNGKSTLEKLLQTAILLVIKNDPVFPLDKIGETEEERKRAVTENNLKWILETIHIPTFDNFVENLPNKIINIIFHFWESFRGVFESNQFYVYDKDAKGILANVKSYWQESLSYGHQYNPNSTGDTHHYYLPMDMFPNRESENDFKLLTKNTLLLHSEFKKMICYIRENYININLDETSETAISEYIEFHKK